MHAINKLTQINYVKDDPRNHPDPKKMLCQDVLLRIFAYLNCNELLAAKRTCFFWAKIANCDSLWKTLFTKNYPESGTPGPLMTQNSWLGRYIFQRRLECNLLNARGRVVFLPKRIEYAEAPSLPGDPGPKELFIASQGCIWYLRDNTNLAAIDLATGKKKLTRKLSSFIPKEFKNGILRICTVKKGRFAILNLSSAGQIPKSCLLTYDVVSKSSPWKGGLNEEFLFTGGLCYGHGELPPDQSNTWMREQHLRPAQRFDESQTSVFFTSKLIGTMQGNCYVVSVRDPNSSKPIAEIILPSHQKPIHCEATASADLFVLTTKKPTGQCEHHILTRDRSECLINSLYQVLAFDQRQAIFIAKSLKIEDKEAPFFLCTKNKGSFMRQRLKIPNTASAIAQIYGGQAAITFRNEGDGIIHIFNLDGKKSASIPVTSPISSFTLYEDFIIISTMTMTSLYRASNGEFIKNLFNKALMILAREHTTIICQSKGQPSIFAINIISGAVKEIAQTTSFSSYQSGLLALDSQVLENSFNLRTLQLKNFYN